VADVADLAVVGFSGVLARLPRIWSMYRRLLAEARSFRPQAAVLVDAPGFNLRLGPALKRLGIPIFYYIAPQVWAWDAGRAAAMARWVDRLAVILPFEEAIFRAAGVETRFVGHPLLEEVSPEVAQDVFRRELGVAPGVAVIGLLPGSRAQEVARILPVMTAAVAGLRAGPAAVPGGFAAVVAAAPGLPRTAYGAARAAGLHVVDGRTHAVQAHADACVVASGTATLETALLGTPHVIVYRTGRLNYGIARRLVRLRRIGLPNIIAGEDVVPELVQDECVPEAIAGRLARWLADPGAARRVRERLATVRTRLGAPGASRRAAAWLWEMVA
jgi:lipid-A-disaccharide synthase